MKLCLAVMLASICAVAVSPAIAGDQVGYVRDLYVRDSDGLIYVYLYVSGGPSHSPDCVTNTHPVGGYWVIPNETTDTGRRLFSTLLAAQISNRFVKIEGKNTCSRWHDAEDIDTVDVIGLQFP